MNWLSKINKIVCLNLAHREDRLFDFTEQMEKYAIPFDRVEAIYDKEHGARGLRDTMVRLFKEEVEKNTEHILVFEDDAKIVVSKDVFDDSMNRVMDQLPPNYQMVFLGCQLTSNGCRFQSPNLINVKKAFSTHAVLYSLQGMRDILSRVFDYPIDNWYVTELQNQERSYCTYPFLVSQTPGHSDIGKNFVDWTPFLDTKFNQQVARIRR